MITINSISGGKSSAYMAANYKADINIFCLVMTDDKKLLWNNGKDEKNRQLISDKLGVEFIGTLEQDKIIYTILDLEQFMGQEIIWLHGKTFDSIIKRGEEKVFLPSKEGIRFCTTELKIKPIYQYLRKQKTGIVNTNIGFRADEKQRVDKKKLGLINGVEKYNKIDYSIPKFPLFENNVDKKIVNNFWKDKKVLFADENNCVGCFHRSIPFLNVMSKKEPEKFKWFIEKEKNTESRWKNGTTYEKIMNTNFTIKMDFSDFGSCDTGYCNS